MGAEILLSGVFCGAVLTLAGRRPQTSRLGEKPFALWALLLFLGAFILRLYLGCTSEGFSTDLDTFKSWGNLLNDVGFSQVYNQGVYLDYPPGYLYVLSFLDRLRRGLGLSFSSPTYTLLLKLPSLLADMLCAGALLWLGKRKLGEKEALLLSGAYLLCPVVLVNSAQWGQVDSVTTAILLGSVLLLYRERYVPSALLYGLSIACKPQMLIFAPLYLFFALKRRRWGKLLLGVACAVGVILLTAAPFTEGWNFLWLLEKYKATMDYYCYYSVNAYNFWALIGWNWRGLPNNGSVHLLTLAAPVLATALCGGLIFFSKRKDALFACPVLLMTVMYLFGVKMHERYLYPIFLFLLLSFLFTPDKRLLRAFSLSSLANYLNVAYTLYLFQKQGGNYDPNEPLIRCLAAVQVLALGYLLYVLWAVYIQENIQAFSPAPEREWIPSPPVNARFTRLDWFLTLGVTLLYAAVAFWHLGGHETALTSWTPREGEAAVLQAEGPCDVLYYLPGVAEGEPNRYRTGVDLLVETSQDGVNWTDCGLLSSGSSYVFTWAQYRLEHPASYVRLTAQNGSAVLNETALKLQGKTLFSKLKAQGPGTSALIDEQELVPKYTTYENSAYFDEIYHARTAYENILGLEPYENTHPPLGKYIISLGIRLFGMNPFGWRFMGTLFGVLMLPALYFLLKQLFGKPYICCAGTLLFALDFMHFTQTRIATIDTYAVFFLLLMYGCMAVFLRRDLLADPMKKLLPPLLFCGLFTGLGIACKWTAAYGAFGLAVLFFGKLFLSLRAARQEGAELPPLKGKLLRLCLWCCLFFLLIPFGLYFAAYLPLTTLPHNIGDIWGSFWRYQTNMYNYHASLQATHFFASPWYEWPLDLRPVWYFSNEPVNDLGQYSTISSFGNPLLWWAGIPTLLSAGVLWVRKRGRDSAAALCGFLSVYLPWVLVPRISFIYHYFTAVPFLIVALCGVFYRLPDTRLGSLSLSLGKRKLSASNLLLFLFIAGCFALFCVYFPVISGAPADKAYTEALRLFPTWYF